MTLAGELRLSLPWLQQGLGVRERALFIVTELSHVKTARTLDELCGIGVSHGHVLACA